MTSPNDLAYNTLTAYYEQTPLFLTRHHIDSYEHFVFNEFPQIIFSSNPKVILKDPLPEKGLYRYKVEIYFGGNVEISLIQKYLTPKFLYRQNTMIYDRTNNKKWTHIKC